MIYTSTPSLYPHNNPIWVIIDNTEHPVRLSHLLVLETADP